MGRPLLLIGFLLFFSTVHADGFDSTTWIHIDTSIKKKRNLSAIYNLVLQLRQKSFSEQKYFDAARCYYYQVLIADQRTEDSFYFRNSAVFDSLLMTQPDNPRLRYVVEILLAKRIAGFTGVYHPFNRMKYESTTIPINYASYPDSTLDNMATIHFENAKRLAKEITFNSAEGILWLSSDPLVFLFKPGPFDIAVAEQIETETTSRYTDRKSFAKKQNWISLPQDEFISMIDFFYFNNPRLLAKLPYYHDWLRHQSSNPEAYYYIETLVRKYVYEKIKREFRPGEEFDDDYLAYLELVSHSAYKPPRAHAVFQLCLYWEKQGTRYFPSGRMGEYGYKSYDTYGRLDEYDTAYRYYPVKALKLFEQNKDMLDSFSYMKRVLLQMEQRILASRLSIDVQEYNLPGEPILAELSHHNIHKLYYSIVQMNTSIRFLYSEKDEFIERLRQLPEVVNNVIDIPATDDHNWHALYFKLDALPKGTYALLFSSNPITDSNKQVQRVYLKITSIAVVTNKNNVFVLDRKSGFPLNGAKVKGYYTREKSDTMRLKKLKSKAYTINAQGFAVIDNGKIDYLEVAYKGDTSFANYSNYEGDFDQVYSKEEYDDLSEFYEDNATAYFFTDRSIYRPGQDVHFKGIFLTRNKNTAEWMVMSKQNLEKSFLKNIYNKWLKGSDPEIYLSDPFSRKIDTIKVKLNDFGSISASFKIPQAAATGEWSIDAGYVDAEGGSFRVEEYKRPTYEISIDNPTKELLPGDSFSVKANVNSFAGAAMSNVRLHYKIERIGPVPYLDSLEENVSYSTQHVIIADSIIYTNAMGEATITIDDQQLKQKSLPNDKKWDFNYQITAETVDGTGESYEATATVSVSSQPIAIDLLLKDNYDRNDKNTILISATDATAGSVSKDIHIKISRLVNNEKLYNDRRLKRADLWIYSVEQLEQWFPSARFNSDSITRQLVMDKTIHTDNVAKLDLDPAIFTAGNYIIEASCEDNGQLLGRENKYFSVFDSRENKLPDVSTSFYNLVYDEVSTGDTVKYYNGHSEGPVYSIYYLSWYSVKDKMIIADRYEMISQDKGVHLWKWKVPDDAKKQLLLTQVYVLNNQLYKNEEEITISKRQTEEPEIIVEQYRKKLSPGSKETFSVTIKTKNENTAAELMTTVYDASLDKLSIHSWDKPEPEDDFQMYDEWSYTINSTVNNYSYPYYTNYYRNRLYDFRLSEIIAPTSLEGLGSTDQLANFGFENNINLGYSGKPKPLWWLNPLDHVYNPYEADVMGDWNDIPARRVANYARGNVVGYLNSGVFDFDDRPAPMSGGTRLLDAGASLFARKDVEFGDLYLTGVLANQRAQRSSLPERARHVLLCPSFKDETVTTTAIPFLRIGSGDTRELNATIVRLNKEFSLASYKQPMIILNGELFKGNLDAIDQQIIVQGIILKGADAVTFFGPKAAEGVLVLSTDGNIVLFEPADEPPLTLRNNFKETAFFSPAIYADKEGFYKFTFTMPETVTEWNWKMMAHTKKAEFVYAERKINTQLPVMVQPNMPRLLYQGDRIILQNRISNLDSANINGKAICKIEDVVTGEDITALCMAKPQNDFSVARKENISSAFEIRIPKTQVNPIRVIVSARTQNFADGEEHVIPVLSPKVWVKESVAFHFSKSMDTTIQPATLPSKPELYGVGLSISPKQQTALINALPYLANYSFDCAEQLFNKMIAHITALNLMRRDEEAQRSYDKAKQAIGNVQEQNDLVPGNVAELNTPWLSLDNKTQKQQKELFELLDTNRTEGKIYEYLNKLYKLQNKDGGMNWFSGGKSDPYISEYVLAGFGKLESEHLLHSGEMDSRYKDFIKDLFFYCQENFDAIAQKQGPTDDLLFSAYARSFWIGRYSPKDSFNYTRKYLHEKFATSDESLYDQSILIITALRYFESSTNEYKKAIELLHSIEQKAIRDVNGIRWKELADADDMSRSSEETVALLAEAFTESRSDTSIVPGIIKWLLTAKSEDHWSSTKATSAVISLLYSQNHSATGPVQTINSTIGNYKLSVTDDLLSGSSYSFVHTSTPAIVDLKKENNAAATGNIIWYYFSSPDSLAKISKDIKLTKEFYRYNETESKWEPVTGKTSLKIADKIKVTLTIEASKALRYVYLDDKRAAGFEPKENNSGYRHEQGFSYYVSVRDAGVQFFSEFIPPGRSTISYEMIVAQEGEFSSGPASLQCMYNPEVNVYSNGAVLQVTR